MRRALNIATTLACLGFVAWAWSQSDALTLAVFAEFGLFLASAAGIVIVGALVGPLILLGLGIANAPADSVERRRRPF